MRCEAPRECIDGVCYELQPADGDADVDADADVDLDGDVAPCVCDLTGDGTCGEADYEAFRAGLGRTDCLEPGVTCNCDLDHDGACTLVDYQVWYADYDRPACQT